MSILGDRVATIAFVFLVIRLSGSFAPALALFYVARVLPTLSAGLLAGVIVDQLDRKRLMIACDLGRTLLLCAAPAGALVALWTIYPLVALLYALTLLFNTAARAALPDVVPEERMMGANAVLLSLQTAGDVAYALGGYLVFALGVRMPFFIDAATFAFSAASISFMTIPRHGSGSAPQVGDYLSRIREGVSFLFGQPFLRASSFAYTMASLSIGAGFVITPLYADRVLRHSAGLVGPLTSGAFRFSLTQVGLGAGAFVGSALTERIAGRWAAGTLFAVGLLVSGLAEMLLALTTNVYVATGLLAVSGFFTSLFVVTAMTLLQALTPTGLRGRVVAGRTTLIQTAWAFGSLIAGLALLELPIQSLWVAEGGLIAAASLFVWRHPAARLQR